MIIRGSERRTAKRAEAYERAAGTILNSAVIVAALGYFVDIYDLILFSIVRIPSLVSLGLEKDQIFVKGVLLLNMQMAGMLVGGLVWGILGDKKGRISVLFGSIITYSLANIANSYVHSVGAYAVWRFVAGVGLAGELGVGITLVSEVLKKELRGYGTTLVASFGICGALLAGAVAQMFDWRIAYLIGGVLGLALLALRVSLYESRLFEKSRSQAEFKTKSFGSFLALFRTRERATKYIACILIGVPIWYVIGILVTFSPEFAKAMGVVGEVRASTAVMSCYAGLALGDLGSGLFSQWLGSRKKVVLAFLVFISATIAIYLGPVGRDAGIFYALCGALGFGAGYWAMFVTIAAEHFGTNMRATVATTVPNFVRGSVVPVTSLFVLLKERIGIIQAASWLGAGVIVIALFALIFMEETFAKDLDYVDSI